MRCATPRALGGSLLALLLAGPAAAQSVRSHCSGNDTIGVYQSEDDSHGVGGRFFLRNRNTVGPPSEVFRTEPTRIPVAGDWDGDCEDSAGIYDSSNGRFLLFNEHGLLGDPDSASVQPADIEAEFLFGGPGQVPIAGDWTGRGFDTVGVYDPSTGRFRLRNPNPHTLFRIDASGTPQFQHVLTSFRFQRPGRIPLAGDWNGDGIDTIGVYDPATATFYLRNRNSAGRADLVFRFQRPERVPVAGDWDGDGVSTIGSYDQTRGKWLLRNSNSTGPVDIQPFFFQWPLRIPATGNWDGR